MNKMLSLLFIFTSSLFSQIVEPTGFQDIKFSTSYDTTKHLLIKKFELKKSIAGISYFGEYYVDFYGDFIIINNYELGDRIVDLHLHFNKNNKFYKFTFALSKYTANYFDTKVKSDVLYISKIFSKKYGPPRNKYSPGFFDIQEGFYSYFWKWWRKKHTIYTAIATDDSEYYAVGVVFDDLLEKEHKIIKEKQEKDSIQDATKSF